MGNNYSLPKTIPQTDYDLVKSPIPIKWIEMLETEKYKIILDESHTLHIYDGFSLKKENFIKKKVLFITTMDEILVVVVKIKNKCKINFFNLKNKITPIYLKHNRVNIDVLAICGCSDYAIIAGFGNGCYNSYDNVVELFQLKISKNRIYIRKLLDATYEEHSITNGITSICLIKDDNSIYLHDKYLKKIIQLKVSLEDGFYSYNTEYNVDGRGFITKINNDILYKNNYEMYILNSPHMTYQSKIFLYDNYYISNNCDGTVYYYVN